MIDVAVVGAGVAGLACASKLIRSGRRVAIFDKGRRPGGRVATRRADGHQFDHGAQYATAHTAEFGDAIETLAGAGSAASWLASTHTRVVGTPSMSALAKGFGDGLIVRQRAHVTSIAPSEGGWKLSLGAVEVHAARVVVTVPAPQVAGLLGQDHALVAELGAVRMAPCLTLMAAVNGDAPFVTHDDPEDPLAWIACDTSKPGRPKNPAIAWVAQAGPAFSRTHVDDDLASIVARMLPMLRDRLSAASDSVIHATAHRWRYARVIEPLGRPFLRSPEGTLYLGGDWCLGARIEAAWISGTRIADNLLEFGA